MVGEALMQNVDDAVMEYLPVYTKEEILEILAISRKQIENGECQEMHAALDELRRNLEL